MSFLPDPPKFEHKRAESLKVTIEPALCRLIMNCAASLQILLIDIETHPEQPTPEEMRAVLEPAYDAIAPSLASILGLPYIDPKSLHGLELDLRPTLGFFKIVVYRIDGNMRKTYNIKVFSKDGRTTFMRNLASSVGNAAERADEFMYKL